MPVTNLKPISKSKYLRYSFLTQMTFVLFGRRAILDSKVHGANMGLTCVLSAPDGPHVGPMNLAIRDVPGCSWYHRRRGPCTYSTAHIDRSWLHHGNKLFPGIIIVSDQSIRTTPNYVLNLSILQGGKVLKISILLKSDKLLNRS